MNLDGPITVRTHLAAWKMECEHILRMIKTMEEDDKPNAKIVDAIVEYLEKEIIDVNTALVE